VLPRKRDKDPADPMPTKLSLTKSKGVDHYQLEDPVFLTNPPYAKTKVAAF
jgi:hypothetical protein